MPSLQSKLIYLVFKYNYLLKLRLKPEVWDDNTSITGFRRQVEEGAKKNRMPEGVTVEAFTIDGMPAEWLLPPQGKTEGVILYAIGGGYVSGSLNDHRALIAKIVKGSGVSILAYEHRLAPEDPYPAALEDTLAAYRWLLAGGYSPEKIMIVGESAGGGLCLSALLALRDQGDPLPAAAVAISPMTDFTGSGESHRTKRPYCVSPVGMFEVCAKLYTAGQDPALPYISPLFGDLHGLPPLMINAGEYDTLFDDSMRFVAKARAAGVEVTFREGPQMIHCYPLLAGLFPEATQALDEICGFINSHIGGG